MALARYREKFWFPDGSLAVSLPARIFPLQSNSLAPIFNSVTGAVALPNPLPTDGTGFLDFWAEEGEYWIHIDTEAFRIQVGSPNTLDVFEGTVSTLSTGLVWGGTMAAAGTSVSFGETLGYVVDHTTDPIRPTVARVHKAAQLVALDGPALGRTVTWWMLNSAGTFVQQALPPSNDQRRDNIVLGFSILFGGVVVFTKVIPTILPQSMNQADDLMDSLGTFRISGGEFTPNGVNKKLNISAGLLFSRGFGHGLTPKNPHQAPLAAQTPAQFRIATRSTTSFPAPVTDVDVANYDVGGVITPVPGGTNTSTLQRIFVFAQDNAPDQILIQYGQATYASLSAAVAAVGQGGFVVNPQLGSTGALAAFLAVTKSATNLSDPAQATIIPANKFDHP